VTLEKKASFIRKYLGFLKNHFKVEEGRIREGGKGENHFGNFFPKGRVEGREGKKEVVCSKGVGLGGKKGQV